MVHLSGTLLQELLSSALYATLMASEGIMKIFKSEDFEVRLKSDNTPLTSADRLCQNIILAELKRYRIPIISEELRVIRHAEREHWELFWLIDPIDGTKELITNSGDFTVNIALIENSTPCLGVVLAPAHGMLYFAIRDQGAFRISDYQFQHTREECEFEALIRQAERLPLREATPRPFKALCSRSHLNPKMSTYLEMIRREHPDLVQELRGSSLKFCLVAEGSADIYPRITSTFEWDTAAGQAIVTMAGKQVVDMHTFMPLRYNSETLTNPAFIVRSDASVTVPSYGDLEQMLIYSR